jgi:hypothetical protein
MRHTHTNYVIAHTNYVIAHTNYVIAHTNYVIAHTNAIEFLPRRLCTVQTKYQHMKDLFIN